MAITIDFEVRNEGETETALAQLEQSLAASRDTIRDINSEAMRGGFIVRDFANEIASAEQRNAQQRDAMTKESFEKWIGYATSASDWTRRTFSSSVSVIGAGIANQLVDGTNDWQLSLRGVLKEMIAVTAQMIFMRTLMTVLTGGTAGWLGFLHEGGSVMHAGGPVRAHAGMSLADDEVPVIAQRGEFILRRRAVESIGEETLARLNRGESAASASPTFNISVSVHAPADAESLARELGPEIVAYLRRESRRGVKIL